MNTIITNLKNIDADYKPIPFWSWNDKLEPEVLEKQIEWMHDVGMGGFFMHARPGLKTEYLSEDWMHCIETCCEKAEELGMGAWAYDENGWPSGFAGGKLLHKESNRDMYIRRTQGDFDEAADISYLLTDDQLVRVTCAEPGKEYLNLYLIRSASTVDILNPDVLDQFLEVTHEQYKKHFGDDFSSKIKGFFTDEPQYFRNETPYSEMLVKYFKEQYQEDIYDKLGLLFVEKEGYRTFRYRYWLAMQTLMLESFGKKTYEWCDKNGIQLTGHYAEEVTLAHQLTCCGGVMPFYEYMHIPGVDWLGHDTDKPLAFNQLGSAASQLGKKHVLTESFACIGWDTPPDELKRILGIQFVNGVNLLCHHLIPYSEHGQRKRDYPQHYIPINPWVNEHFSEFNDYFTRLGYLLAEGEEQVNVAILHPMRSLYFDYKRDKEKNGFEVRDLEMGIRSGCRIFSSRGIAYHFLDETLLEKHGFVDGTSIGCGKCAYTYLVIPKILTMGKHTEKLIKQFVANGGKVLLLDEKPTYLEGAPHEYPYLESNCSLEEIIQTQPFSVENTDTDIFCAYRKYGDTPFIFIQNAAKDAAYTQTFHFGDDIKSFTALDLITLETRQIPLSIEVPGNGAFVLFPSTEIAPEPKALKEYKLKFQNADVKYDTNFLTIDKVVYSKDGINYSEPLFKNQLFSLLLQERYEGRLWVKYEFEIETIPEKLTLLAEKGDAIQFLVNDKPFTFTEAYADEPSLWMGDVTSLVCVGRNTYEAIMDWHQSEATYYALFGENVTETLRNCIAYDSEIEDIYLAGKFGVYSHDAYKDYGKDTVLGQNFYIGKATYNMSEPTVEGLPFFRGKLTMSQTITLSDTNILLNVEGRYQAAKVWVNGKKAGDLFFGRKLDISPYAVQGENKIVVEFTISNRNMLGAFHDGGDESYGASFGAVDFQDYKLYRFYAMD